jgi:putative Holliday junction resolvase
VTAPRRLLGLDVGERRIGVAVSEGRIAVPLSIIEHTNREGDIKHVLTCAREQDAAAIVVGLPLHASGDEGEQARRTRRFGDDLAARTDLPVHYQNELLSSVDAEAAAVAGGRRKQKHLDDRAAAIILQRYLDAQVQN